MKKVIVSFAFLFLLFSCREKIGPEVEKYVQFSIEVSLDTTGVATKTSMYDDGTVGKVTWSSTDYLTIFAAGDDTFEKGVKSQNAVFISDDHRKALFKFDVVEGAASFLAGTNCSLYYGNADLGVVKEYGALKFSISIPANQTHAGINCFQEFENVAFGYCPSGTFKYEETSGNYVGTAGCVMRNAFGILKVPITLTGDSNNDPGIVRYVRLTDRTAGQYLAGTFDVTINKTGDNVGAPKLTHKSGSGGESRTIEKTILASNPLTTAANFVYFLVPPATLFGDKGLGLAVYTDDGYYGNKTIVVKDTTGAPTIQRSKITQINISSFTKKKYPVPQPLTANSYVFEPTAGVGSFPAQYKGNSYQGNGLDVVAGSNQIPYNSSYYAEILWQTRCNGETLLAAEVIDSPVYYNSTDIGPCISFHKSGVSGNALIALRNPNEKVTVRQLDGTDKQVDKILWSWHVWISDYPADAVVYNATDQTKTLTIMDRNIGALSALPSGLSQFHGLAYQYGRKDPFMGSRYTTFKPEDSGYGAYASIYPPTAIWTVEDILSDFEKSVVAPNVRYMGSNAWCMSNTNVGWGSPAGNTDEVYPKTLVDPCPVGWKVVSEASIGYVLGHRSDSTHIYNKPAGKFVVSGEGYAFELTNNHGSPVYFPAAGSSVAQTGISNVGTSAMVWTATVDKSTYSTSTVFFNAYHTSFTKAGADDFNLTSSGLAMKTTMPVRCQKYNEPSVPSAGETKGILSSYIADNDDYDVEVVAP